MEFDSLICNWDGETVITHYDRLTGAWIFIAIHSTRRGPACGGTRMKAYPDVQSALQDVLKLAAGMTFKFAVADFEFGGGKAVIALPPHFDLSLRAGLLRRYGALIRQLGGLYYTGPDVGTTSADMDVIAETGAPFVFARTPQAGGAGDSGPITALGVFYAMQTTCATLDGNASLSGRKVLVQGAGIVGKTLIEHLLKAGAQVCFSDVDPAAIEYCRTQLGLSFVPPDQVYSTPCDIFAPCALGGILNATTIPTLHCRAIVGAANNQLASLDAAESLRNRNILYAPDFVINLGGAIGITGIEALHWSQAEAEQRVIDAVTRTLREVFDLARNESISTDTAARRIVQARLDEHHK